MVAGAMVGLGSAGPPATGMCGLCAQVLGEPRERTGLLLRSPCGRQCHFECLRRRISAGEPLSCGACVVECFEEYASSLRMICEAASAVFSNYPSELELWVSRELTLGRPVTLLREVPPVIFEFSGLRCLDFTGHPIAVVPPAISRLRSLKRLVLISAYLQELPDEICDMSGLEQLFVCCCNLQKMPARLGELPNLWRLYMDLNQIRTLPERFPTRIDGLKITGNLLERIPDSIGECKGLRDILANGNMLTTIPESLCRLTSVRHLMLHGNQLRSLPESIGLMSGLESLLVHDNHLERLPDSVSDLPGLEWLYVYNNHLRELPKGLTTRPPRLERLLVEANPLSEQAVCELLATVPGSLRLFGVDDAQLALWRRCVGEGAELPPNVTSGRMLPFGRLYAKLTSGARLSSRCRPGGRAAPAADPGAAARADVLVVAFSASQGEPEWMRQLGQLLHWQPDSGGATNGRHAAGAGGGPPVAGGAAPGAGAPRRLRDLCEAKPGGAPSLGAGIWREFCDGEAQAGPHAGFQKLRDFDVLCLCDTNCQWYQDTPHLSLSLEEKLEPLIAEYTSVLFLGVSMGGFAALSIAHLADTVAIFGPQTDLSLSHLRPGWSEEELAAANERMRRNVTRALQMGTKIQYHVDLGDHLLLARRLPLPRGALVIHPLCGRIARVLERAGLLAPLLVGLVAERQREGPCRRRRLGDGEAAPGARPTAAAEAAVVVAPPDAGAAASAAPVAWSWADAETQCITLARWRPNGAMETVSATPQELGALCREPPTSGDWFCGGCGQKHEERSPWCRRCGSEGGPPQRRIACSASSAKSGAKQHMCKKCWKKHPKYARQCEDCGGALELICDFCFGRFADVPSAGRPDPLETEWYCNPCWGRFASYNQTLRREIPEAWFQEGGQLWKWAEEAQGGGASRQGTLELSKGGRLITPWGDGTWQLAGGGPPPALEVRFGRPTEAWRLERTASGFLARRSPPGGGGVARGTPIYGACAPLPRLPGGLLRAVAAKLLHVLWYDRISGRGGALALLAVIILGVTPAAYALRRALRRSALAGALPSRP